MRLYLVRHGETESNRLGLALGRADVPLNERGLWQAQRLAAALAGEPIAAVYSSPLCRALDTAGPIASALGLPVEIEPGLVEMEIGEVEGLTFAEIRARFPGLLKAWMSPEGQARGMPGGERLVDVQARAWGAVQAIADGHPEQSACAVTHNFVILSVLTRVLGLDLAEFRRLRHAVAAVSVLDLRPGRGRIITLNDTCHLDDQG